MAYHNEVRPGDTFAPTASMHNDTARLLNSINGFSSKTGKSNKPSATVLKVYNPTDEDFAPGTPVNFDNDQAIVEEHVPIKSYSDEQAPWGVLKDGLQAGCFGSCIVSGPVTVTLSGEGKYAVPSESGFELADEAPEGNSALVLYKNTEQAVICLGAGGGGDISVGDWGTITQVVYNFMYKIVLDKKKTEVTCIFPVQAQTTPLNIGDRIFVHKTKLGVIPVYDDENNLITYIINKPINFHAIDKNLIYYPTGNMGTRIFFLQQSNGYVFIYTSNPLLSVFSTITINGEKGSLDISSTLSVSQEPQGPNLWGLSPVYHNGYSNFGYFYYHAGLHLRFLVNFSYFEDYIDIPSNDDFNLDEFKSSYPTEIYDDYAVEFTCFAFKQYTASDNGFKITKAKSTEDFFYKENDAKNRFWGDYISNKDKKFSVGYFYITGNVFGDGREVDLFLSMDKNKIYNKSKTLIATFNHKQGNVYDFVYYPNIKIKTNEKMNSFVVLEYGEKNEIIDERNLVLNKDKSEKVVIEEEEFYIGEVPKWI